MWQKCAFRHETTFFFLSLSLFWSSLIQSKPIWLQPEKVEFEGNEYICYINVDRTTIRNLQINIFAHLLRFSGQFSSSFGVPSNLVMAVLLD